MNKLEVHNTSKSSQGHEPTQNVQPRANSNGNPLRQSLVTWEYEHSPYQASAASLSILQL